MTCAHVRDLVDAGPLADYPPAHWDAARHHASQCAECGEAWRAMSALDADLSSLPSPAIPADFASSVLARIATLEQRPPLLPIAEDAATTLPSRWPGWATAVGGVTASLAIAMALSSGNTLAAEFGPQGSRWASSLSVIPSSAPGALMFTAGLLLYLVGLFAPPRRG
jgi:hypothetical protein